MLTVDLYPDMEFDQNNGINFLGFEKDKTEHLIKVIGVGGGGGNAVKNMYETGVKNVDFAVCNTDSQALSQSPIPVKVQLGPEGLGVGGDPQLGREKAEESLDDIMRLLGDETKMVFITAGMGGGTGTGASPVIAKAARDKGILTVGVVTLPFIFEKKARRQKALEGILELKKNVDSLLVINNERLLEIYDDNQTSIEEAFSKADEILTTATKSIAEIITENGVTNRDFNDVKSVMKDGGGCIMSVGYGEGDKRIIRAIEDAMNSPLLNSVDIEKAQRLLYIVYTCKDKPVTVSETTEINVFMDTLPEDLEVFWGLYKDDTLGDKVKVAIVATGFDKEPLSTSAVDDQQANAIKALQDFYYPQKAKKEPIPLKEEPNSETPVMKEDASAETEQDELSVQTSSPLSDTPEADIVDFDEDEKDFQSALDKGRSWLKKLAAFISRSLNKEE